MLRGSVVGLRAGRIRIFAVDETALTSLAGIRRQAAEWPFLSGHYYVLTSLRGPLPP
jgi:hypothetical protein